MTPQYVQIADDIRRLIRTGELRAGDEVPSERRLAAEWGVARPTATKALDILRREGLITSRRGGRTYVHPEPEPVVVLPRGTYNDLLAAADIVRKLAARPAPLDDQVLCALCYSDDYGVFDDPAKHGPECLWRQARELFGGV